MKLSSYLLAYFDGHQKSKGFNGLGIDFQFLLLTQIILNHSSEGYFWAENAVLK